MYRDDELCLTKILKNSEGKPHKKLNNNTGYIYKTHILFYIIIYFMYYYILCTVYYMISGTITHRNTKSRTMLEYFEYMSMCLFIWGVFFSMNLPHTNLWHINRS